jgi:hypothetical protein
MTTATVSIQKVPLIAADKALMSLRSSGHDYTSAVGEVIDNSLQANANNVRIVVFTTKKKIASNKKATEVVERVAVGDDGEGMDLDTLHNCLKLGFSTRYNDRKGMGRFGVGAKMGGISQAKRIDIWSRQTPGDAWFHTYIDLDEIESGAMQHIPAPEAAELPEGCDDLVGDRGTLVVWSKPDRLEENESGGGRRADKVKGDLIYYVGRTFRTFLDRGIVINIDGTKVRPHDPLFRMVESRRQADGSLLAEPEVLVDEHFDWPVPSDPNRSSRVYVTLTLLPEETRKERGKGGFGMSETAFKDNEGVSILRADREIFKGFLQGVQPAVDGRPIDRFIGKEIRFEPDLDECLRVRNVKKGAEPIEGLRDKLRDVIAKTIMTARKEVQTHFDKVQAARDLEEGRHAVAEEVAAETQRTARKPKAGKDTPKEDREKAIDDAAEVLVKEVPPEQRPARKAQVKAKIANQPLSMIPDSWPGQEFIEIKHLGSNVIVRINKQHPFYTEIYAKLVSLEKNEGDENVKDMARIIRNGLDLLIVGYARAEGQYEDPSIFDSLRTNWGLELRDLIRHWMKKQ